MTDSFPIEFQVYEVIYLPLDEWNEEQSEHFANEPERQYFHDLESALTLARQHWLVPTKSLPDVNSYGEPPTIYRNVYKGNIGLAQIVDSDPTKVSAELILLEQYENHYSHPDFPGSQHYGDSVEESRNLLR